MTEKKRLEETKKLMGALLRMPPKPHIEMKLGKPKRPKDRAAKRDSDASAKAKTS
jgi:hypothetical protein